MKQLRSALDIHVQNYMQMIRSMRKLESEVRVLLRQHGRTRDLLEMQRFLSKRRKSLELLLSRLNRV